MSLYSESAKQLMTHILNLGADGGELLKNLKIVMDHNSIATQACLRDEVAQSVYEKHRAGNCVHGAPKSEIDNAVGFYCDHSTNQTCYWTCAERFKDCPLHKEEK